MKITKIAHCTLLFECDDIKVLVDPGKFAMIEWRKLTNLEYLIISDIHQDHLNVEGVSELVNNNPKMKLIVTSSVVSKLEGALTIKSESLIIISEETQINIGGLNWTFGLEKHIPAYKDVIKREDVLWYQVEQIYFGSGDTFKLPRGRVELLGLNVLAPFGSMESFVDYAISANPKRVFNIHDGYLNKDFSIGFYGFVKKTLNEKGIEYDFVQDGEVVMNN
jgi:hypothetical protein